MLCIEVEISVISGCIFLVPNREKYFIWLIIASVILLFSNISCYLISIGIVFIGLAYLLLYVGDISDITCIGNIMYTSYFIWLIITSVILLLAMVGSIIITIKQKDI